MTLALYLPTADQLLLPIAFVVISYLVLCVCAARMGLNVFLAALLMAGGCCVALTPDILSAIRADLGDYGNMARKLNHSDSSDAMLTITAYMHVGRGKLVAVGGMSFAIVCHASVVAIHKRLKPNESECEHGEVD